MNLHDFGVERYRAFKDYTNIVLKPITLVFGENNAGKSSLVRFLPSLAQSCKAAKPLAFSPVCLNAGGVGASDFLHANATDARLNIDLGFEEAGDIMAVRYEIASLPEYGVSKISEIELHRKDANPLKLSWQPSEIIGVGELDQFEVIEGGSVVNQISVGFNGLSPEEWGEGNMSKELNLVLGDLKKALKSFQNSVHWIGPLRHVPDRIQRRVYSNYNMSHSGHEAANIIFDLYKKNDQTFSAVSEWYQCALKHRLEVVEGAFEGTELFSS